MNFEANSGTDARLLIPTCIGKYALPWVVVGRRREGVLVISGGVQVYQRIANRSFEVAEWKTSSIVFTLL